VNVTFDDPSTGFTEGTFNDSSLSFFVSGHPVTTTIAAWGSSSNLDLTLAADSCVLGQACVVSGCVGSWVNASRDGFEGHSSCFTPYHGCVRDSGTGVFDLICCDDSGSWVVELI